VRAADRLAVACFKQAAIVAKFRRRGPGKILRGTIRRSPTEQIHPAATSRIRSAETGPPLSKLGIAEGLACTLIVPTLPPRRGRAVRAQGTFRAVARHPSDFAHFCRVHGATGFRARLRLLLASRASGVLPSTASEDGSTSARATADARGSRSVRSTVRSRTAAHEDEPQRCAPGSRARLWIAPGRGLHLAGGGRGPRLDASRRQYPRRRRQAWSAGHPRLGERVILAPALPRSDRCRSPMAP